MNTYLRVYIYIHTFQTPRSEIYVSNIKLIKNAGFVRNPNVRSKNARPESQEGKKAKPYLGSLGLNFLFRFVFIDFWGVGRRGHFLCEGGLCLID
jgi:hypothetical protein